VSEVEYGSCILGGFVAATRRESWLELIRCLLGRYAGMPKIGGKVWRAKAPTHWTRVITPRKKAYIGGKVRSSHVIQSWELDCDKVAARDGMCVCYGGVKMVRFSYST
jgi:hypothetical protein